MHSIENSLFFNRGNSMFLNGVIGKAIKYIQNEQLCKDDLWSKFVELFKGTPDTEDSGWRSEYWGKTMRGASLVYSVCKSKRLYDSIVKTVDDLIAVENIKKVVTTYSPEQYFSGWDIWGRKYIILGLEYFLEICESATLKDKVLAFICRQADYITEKIGEGKISLVETSYCHGGMNSASILESFARLYGLTENKKYLDFSEYIISTGGCSNGDIFKLALENKVYPFQYPQMKMYEMISCFEGVLELYKVTGKKEYLIMVINFVDKLYESDITAIGCGGCTDEMLDNSAKVQTENRANIMQETCVTVTWLKMCYKLFKLTGNARYADYVEQSVYNAMLGAMNYNKLKINFYDGDGAAFLPADSYSPLYKSVRGRVVGGMKNICNDEVYGCCACIIAAGIGIAAQMVCLNFKDGLIFNLYEEAALTLETPTGQKITATMAANYPADGKIKINLKLGKAEKFKLLFRVPIFVKKYIISVDGKKLQCKAEGQFVSIEQTWIENEIVFDMLLPVFTVELNNKISLRYGALVLARDERLSVGDFDNPIDLAKNKNGELEYENTNLALFDRVKELSFTNKDGSRFTVIDYSSAGKEWQSKNARVLVWLDAEQS